ncbi:carbohydrate-binding module family 50 protein [Neolentinus lepideus HHB14362 ss-1]|uniref:Carbohydrate-binding module family 50 protein n=1 Tax=Neolentinus lepideus HHB14362 ss-1 TaxID=1314782 RepID=A0A165Q4Y9_9AGAM|nr:carbohydrate-binding module family 50 protein [Neolentinus lepideus HHB14362 ss-1]
MFSKTLAAALLAVPFVAQSVAAADCTRSYTIQAGDICDTISQKQNVSSYQLAVVNYGTIDSACSNLTPGKTLCLGYPGEDCATTYVVRKDDTCDSVMSGTGLNSTIFWANNPQIDSACSNMYIGQVLCTATKVQVPPAPSGTSYFGAQIPATATPAQSSATATATATDEDDDDLPYCDEL